MGYTDAQIVALRELESAAETAAEEGIPLADAIAEITTAYNA